MTSFFLMYICKNTRALYGYFNVSSLLLWRKLCASSHTLNLEEYFILFILVFEGIRKEVIACLKQRESITLCLHTQTHMLFLFLFLTYIPNNCTSFHFPCFAGAFTSQSDTFKPLSPSISLIKHHINHVCRVSDTTLCNKAEPGTDTC